MLIKNQSLFSKTLYLGLLLTAGISCAAFGSAQEFPILEKDALDDLKIRYEEQIIPGLQHEYHIFFAADAHISLCDERDETVMEKALSRQPFFVDEQGTPAWETFDKLVKASNTLEADLFVMGGDILDSAMYASIEFLEEELKLLKAPYLYELGNHDFEYGTEYFSDTAYQEYFPRLKALRGDAFFASAEYDDLVVFAANDHNNRIDRETLQELRRIDGLDKPIIVVTHVPLQPQGEHKDLREKCDPIWGVDSKGNSRVLIGDQGIRPDSCTQKFVNLIMNPKRNVSLVLAGHIHLPHKDSLNGKIDQLITGAAYEKEALFITLKPEA